MLTSANSNHEQPLTTNITPCYHQHDTDTLCCTPPHSLLYPPTLSVVPTHTLCCTHPHSLLYPPTNSTALHNTNNGQAAQGWTISTPSQDNIITVITRGLDNNNRKNSENKNHRNDKNDINRNKISHAADRVGAGFPFDAGDRAVRQLTMIDTV